MCRKRRSVYWTPTSVGVVMPVHSRANGNPVSNLLLVIIMRCLSSVIDGVRVKS